MSPQTYNAYYNPSNNEIVLPAGIFTVPGKKMKSWMMHLYMAMQLHLPLAMKSPTASMTREGSLMQVVI